MDYTVILSPKAVRDLEKIVRYIALNNPEAARKERQQIPVFSDTMAKSGSAIPIT